MIKLDDQPPDDMEWLIADQVFVKQMFIANAGSFIPQHAHQYDHVSALAKGKVRVWEDGVWTGDHQAPHMLLIKAKVKHLFQSLEDDTIIYCIHNASHPDVAAVFAEHQIVV